MEKQEEKKQQVNAPRLQVLDSFESVWNEAESQEAAGDVIWVELSSFERDFILFPQGSVDCNVPLFRPIESASSNPSTMKPR